ncbi:MAG: TolC family protein [Treponema sp.]|jgi:outer membrane protein TolC|nr:TolC family protein [Treponema sp.]
MKRFVLLLLTITTFRGFAEDSITLERVRTLALANSRSLAAHNLAIRSSVLDERSELYSNLPSLSVGAGTGTNIRSLQNGLKIQDAVDGNINLSISQKIFQGGKSLVYRRIASINTEIARNAALAEYFSVLDQADSAYYGVLEAAANLLASESSLETAALALSIAEIKAQGGMINRGDYLRALSEKETAENNRNRARRDLSLSKTKLSALTGLAELPALLDVDFGSYELLFAALYSIEDEKIDALSETLWNKAAAANPSLLNAGLSGRNAEYNYSLAKRDFSPVISASFSTGFNFSSNGTEFSAGRLSLSGSIPLDVWVTANNAEKKKTARDSAALDYLDSAASLRTELKTALLDIISQAGTVLSSRRSREYAEQHFEYTMELFRLSGNSVSDLSDASSLLNTSRSQLIQAEYALLSGLSRLRSLCGILDEEELIKLLEEVP